MFFFFFFFFLVFFFFFFFFFSSRRRHTRCSRDWSSDVCSSDLWANRQLLRSSGCNASCLRRAHRRRGRIWSSSRRVSTTRCAKPSPRRPRRRGQWTLPPGLRPKPQRWAQP